MKSIFTALVILISFSCSQIRPKYIYPGGESYKVVKTDSINNWYVIYAKRHGIVYKIVSQKASHNPFLKPLKINKRYHMQLSSLIAATHVGGRKIVGPIDCIMLDSTTKVCVEHPTMPDIYVSTRFKGLQVLKLQPLKNRH